MWVQILRCAYYRIHRRPALNMWAPRGVKTEPTISMVSAQKATDSMTDSMKDIPARHIRPGSDTCPSCKSHRWNSAILVVMEGATNAKRTFTATTSTAEQLCGSINGSLLSDRWFSWNCPIEADIGLSSSTGLVQEVKRFMAEFGPDVQMPAPPRIPNPTTSISDIPKEFPENPPVAQASTEPTRSGMTEEPATRKEPGKAKVRSMLRRPLIVIVSLLAVLFGANAFFGNDLIAELPLFTACAVIMIIAALKARKMPTAALSEDEARQEERPNWFEILADCAEDRRNFQEEAERFRIRYEESQRRLSEYKRALEETTVYKQKLAEYKSTKSAVLKARELLWERTRLCMQCGTVYLGPD